MEFFVDERIFNMYRVKCIENVKVFTCVDLRFNEFRWVSNAKNFTSIASISLTLQKNYNEPLE